MNELEDLKVKGNAQYKEGNLNEAGCEHVFGVAPEMVQGSVSTRYSLTGVRQVRKALTELKVVQRADPTFDDELESWLRRAHHWLSKPKGSVNYYRFMQLPMDASREEIRKQYHKLCLVWHPDKNGGTEEGRQRFEELQQAYKFLMDEERREQYDFGIWKDKHVRHHVKKREKVKDSYDDTTREEDEVPHWYNDCLLDDKVESIYWGDAGVPAWLQEKRRQFKKKT
eukprot:CAMPEP_0115709774 /NCGR_PEP_ID=MMETSP0272-20121206/72655_1 /TAXON_ID=71861 /ORGANISM="Scrippsiella trochoidea, Strain CCMP3099" /LENGTH=225 /DNA_ID=CAMNT_0003151415 /DNA_START=42 /DNA_END=717 /DNA_ORIENTATION=+